MNEFIGNHIKFIHDYGQLIMVTVMAIAATSVYFILKSQKYFIPRTIVRAFVSLLSLLVFVLCLLIFLRITAIKPNVGRILIQLENLKGKKAPLLIFNLFENDSVKTIDSYRGNVVLVNYWATWCGPCLKEIPDLNRIQEGYKSKGVTVLALSDETKERLAQFSNKHPLIVQVGYLKTFDWVDIGSERPVTFLVDRNGVVVDYFTGPHDFKFFLEKINSVL